ncbi:MAG: hypothetical protein N3A63_00235 [Bacteroidetes bacterium]|nr:hypothetical protein [Bacteroidota bacterium]
MEGSKILAILQQILSLSPLLFLYAEIHYSFKYFISLLKKREPEIIADAPHRITYGEPLPILLLIKDAHAYPITLKSVTISIRSLQSNRLWTDHNVFAGSEFISTKWWWRIFWLKLPEGTSGAIECDTVVTIDVNGQTRIYRNDNYRTTSHKPLRIYISKTTLPTYKNLYLGEIHSHSYYTEDQVEFGAPLEPTAILARSLGLTYFAVTDHSYDLDDDLDNYLSNNPEQPKWQLLLREVERIQGRYTTILAGEEVSCRNQRNKNVHFLIINNKEFIPGSGDSAERWFKTQSEFSIEEILKVVNAKDILYIPAHPFEKVSFLQSIFLNRDTWNNSDFSDNIFDGIQFINGALKKYDTLSYSKWIQLLLEGKRLPLFAGNDAHGNFNRYRQILVPFLLMHENNGHIFGKFRTGIFSPTNSVHDLIRSAKEGKTIASDGPVANIQTSYKHHDTLLGQTISTPLTDLVITALSTEEFGALDKIILYGGIVGQTKEVTVFLKKNLQSMNFSHIVTAKFHEFNYVRLEVYTVQGKQDDKSHFCLTSPIWFQKS